VLEQVFLQIRHRNRSTVVQQVLHKHPRALEQVVRIVQPVQVISAHVGFPL
jgi:hypothetical protein